MTRGLLLGLAIALAPAACGLTSTIAPTMPPPTLNVSSTQAGTDVGAPEGWDTFRSDELGFGFAYPASGRLAVGEGVSLTTVDFAADPATNVVEEVISVSGAEGAGPCASPWLKDGRWTSWRRRPLG